MRGRHKGRDVRYRMVLIWNPVHKSHMLLATSLAAADFDSREVRQLYAVRWQIELAFKKWKSYANLRKVNTANPHIVAGLIWAALAAALLKRLLRARGSSCSRRCHLDTNRSHVRRWTPARAASGDARACSDYTQPPVNPCLSCQRGKAGAHQARCQNRTAQCGIGAHNRKSGLT